jgi:hypothetical protein
MRIGLEVLMISDPQVVLLFSRGNLFHGVLVSKLLYLELVLSLSIRQWLMQQQNLCGYKFYFKS